MDGNVYSGQASQDSQPFRGWFVGNLSAWAPQAEDFGLRSSSSIEIKWGVHAKGQTRPAGWAPCTSKTCMSLLVQGDFQIFFRSPADRDTIRVERIHTQGAYVVWREQVEHTWEALEDSLILTVRWEEPEA